MIRKRLVPSKAAVAFVKSNLSLGKTTCSYNTLAVSERDRLPHIPLGREFLDGVA